MKRFISYNLWLALMLLSLSACGNTTPSAPPKPATPAPNPTPTTVAKGAPLKILCSPPKDWCEAITQNFAATSGIQTEFTQLSSSEALGRLRKGRNAPEFDVWYGGPVDAFITAKNEGLLQAYTSPSAAQIPGALKDAAGEWSGVYVGAIGFCVNQNVLSQLGVAVPHTWADLLNPKLKGQVVMPHPATSGTAYTIVWTQVTINNGDRDATFAYFKQLHTNIISYTRGSSGPAPMVAQGQAAVGIVFSHNCVRIIDDGNDHVAVYFPSEGTGYEIGGLALLRGAQNEVAAKSFVDWALSSEAQGIPLHAKYYVLPTNPQTEISAKAPTNAKLLDYDFAASGAAHDAIIERFITEVAPAP